MSFGNSKYRDCTNGCSANVRISGSVVPESLISVPSSGGFAMNASLSSPVKEKSICLSSGLTVRDSEAPANFLSVPVPTNALVLSVSATPET